MDDNQPRHAYPDDHWLLYNCPWCLAQQFQPCIVTGNPRLFRAPHDQRLELVGTTLAQDAGAR